LQGVATDVTLLVFPSTLAKLGSVLTTYALPFTVNVPLPLRVPPRCRSARTVLAFEEVRLPGVHNVPPMLDVVDHEMPVFAATSPPRPPVGPPLLLSNPSVVSELLSWIVPHAQSACVNVVAASAPVQL
jgi:hypothetical protein